MKNAGQEQYHNIRTYYYRDANWVFLFYDIINIMSLLKN